MISIEMMRKTKCHLLREHSSYFQLIRLSRKSDMFLNASNGLSPKTRPNHDSIGFVSINFQYWYWSIYTSFFSIFYHPKWYSDKKISSKSFWLLTKILQAAHIQVKSKNELHNEKYVKWTILIDIQLNDFYIAIIIFPLICFSKAPNSVQLLALKVF